MDDISSFGPSGVVAVGLRDADVAALQEECAARRFRLVVAARTSDLALSLQCDYAIVNVLLPDGDGRKLATDFARAGARVLLVNNVGNVSLFDAWSLGATTSAPSDSPADWLDVLAQVEQVEAVSRAGRLMEPLRLADAVDASAAFSGSSGVPVSFVRIRPNGSANSSIDEMLDRLTSVVGMTTVFYDAPSGERMALVVNGDRRRLTKLLDDPLLTSKASMAVVAVSPEDDLAALIGRSLVQMQPASGGEGRTKVLVALAAGHEKTTEAVRVALHRMEFSAIYWDEAYRYDDGRANSPAAAVIDARQDPQVVAGIIEAAHGQTPAIPVLVVSDDGHIDEVQSAIATGASDFLTWPFQPGDVQAALARVMVIGAGDLEAQAPAPVDAVPDSKEIETPETAEAGLDPETEARSEAQRESEPASEIERSGVDVEVEPEIEPARGLVSSTETETNTDAEPAVREDAQRIVAAVLAERLAAGASITLKGVGVLSVTHETSRIVHDRKGRTIVKPPRRTLSFVQERPPDDQAG